MLCSLLCKMLCCWMTAARSVPARSRHATPFSAKIILWSSGAHSGSPSSLMTGNDSSKSPPHSCHRRSARSAPLRISGGAREGGGGAVPASLWPFCPQSRGASSRLSAAPPLCASTPFGRTPRRRPSASPNPAPPSGRSSAQLVSPPEGESCAGARAGERRGGARRLMVGGGGSGRGGGRPRPC